MRLKVKMVGSAINHLAVFEGEGERFSAPLLHELRIMGKEYEAEFDPVTRHAEIVLEETKENTNE